MRPTSSKSITLVGSNWRLPQKTPRWPARSLYGPRGGTAGLDGRSKRQFHIWHALSPCRGRAASLLILSWMMMDSAPSFPQRGAPPCCTSSSPSPPPTSHPRPVSVLIWQSAGMGSTAEVCEWWTSGIKGGQAARRTVAGSAAALVGSFSPSRRHKPKVRSCEDRALLKPHIQVRTRFYGRQHWTAPLEDRPGF